VILLTHVSIFDDPSTCYEIGSGFGYSPLRPQLVVGALLKLSKGMQVVTGLRKEDTRPIILYQKWNTDHYK
jgi:hypothetical protein